MGGRWWLLAGWSSSVIGIVVVITMATTDGNHSGVFETCDETSPAAPQMQPMSPVTPVASEDGDPREASREELMRVISALQEQMRELERERIERERERELRARDCERRERE